MSISRCYNPADCYKPQWAYPTPEGFHDEPFIVDFSFTIPGDGGIYRFLPWQLDDDVAFLIRGIQWQQIGTGENPGPFNSPALVRITDTKGNPLSDDLVLSLGAWGQSPTGTVQNGAGFPIETEIVCDAGGTPVFDFQLSTTASVAALEQPNTLQTFVFDANVYGPAGNSITVALVAGAALAVAVAGDAVTVTLDSGVTTVAQVVAAINANAAASALILASSVGPAPNEVALAFAATALSGGATGEPITLVGSLFGVKRFTGC